MSAPWHMTAAEIDLACSRASISEIAIDRVVAETGMERLQARYHLQGRAAAVEALERRRRAAISQPLDARPIGEIIRPIMAEIAERVA